MAFGLGSLLGAGLSIAGSLGGKNPGKVSQQQLQRSPEHAYKAYNPFIEQGQEARQQLNPQYDWLMQQRPDYGQMASDPVGWLRNIEEQYSQTPGYQFKQKQLLKGAHNTAAAGGFAGTENDVMNRAALVDALLSGDIQQFLDNIAGIHTRGQAGQERQYGLGLGGRERQVGQGLQASNWLADYLGNVDRGNAAYAGQGANYSNDVRNNVFGALSGLINSGLGGGGMKGF